MWSECFVVQVWCRFQCDWVTILWVASLTLDLFMHVCVHTYVHLSAVRV